MGSEGPGEGRAERFERFRFPLADADLLPRFRIGDDDVGQMRTGGEDPQERAERRRVALEDRDGGEGAADRAEEPLERRQDTVGIGDLRQERHESAAQIVEEIGGDPLGRDAAEPTRGLLRTGEPAGPSPGLRRGVVGEEPARIDDRQRRDRSAQHLARRRVGVTRGGFAA